MRTVSVTDITNFKLCRQKWDYSSFLRQFKRPAKPVIKMRRGSAYHEVLSWMFQKPDYTREELVNNVERAMSYYNVPNIDNEVTIAVDVLTEFDNFKAHHPLLKQFGQDSVIGSEERRLNMLSLRDGKSFALVSYCDLVLESDGKIYIIDFKTTSRITHDMNKARFDDQATAYSAAIWKHYGIVPTFVWIYINTSKLQEPKLLKRGRFSRAKNQYLSMPRYIKAVEDSGQSRDFYSEFIIEHSTTMFNRMFSVVPVKRSERQLEVYWAEMIDVAHEMFFNPVIYTTNNPTTCKMCEYQTPCHHQRLGFDPSVTLNLISKFEAIG